MIKEVKWNGNELLIYCKVAQMQIYAYTIFLLYLMIFKVYNAILQVAFLRNINPDLSY